MRMLLAIFVTWSVAGPTTGVARADDGAPDGRIESDLATIEIVRPGGQREIRTPEGFLRIEDPGDADEGSAGTFGTYHATALDPRETDDGAAISVATPPADTTTPVEAPPPLRRDGMVDTSAPAGANDPCRAQRGRYLRRVLRMSGIDVDRPLDLLDGLAGPGVQGGNLLVGGYLIPGFDAVRPLAWDQELRSLGRDLATCEARSAALAPAPPPPPPARSR